MQFGYIIPKGVATRVPSPRGSQKHVLFILISIKNEFGFVTYPKRFLRVFLVRITFS